MRKIKQMVFMGNGEHSLLEVKSVNKILKEAFVNLSGIQQPSHCASEEQVKEDRLFVKDKQKEIEDAVRDIAMALTGKDIKFK
jgi:hypothetical protein